MDGTHRPPYRTFTGQRYSAPTKGRGKPVSEPAFARAIFDRITYGHFVRPYWRRITSVFTLSFMVIITGLFLAALIGLSILMALFVLERAIS